MKFTATTIATVAALSTTILASPIEQRAETWKDAFGTELRGNQFSLYIQPRWALPGTGAEDPVIISYTHSEAPGKVYLEGWIKLDCKYSDEVHQYHVDGAGAGFLEAKLGHVCNGPGIGADYLGTELGYFGQKTVVADDLKGENKEVKRCEKVEETKDHPAMAKCVFDTPYMRTGAA